MKRIILSTFVLLFCASVGVANAQNNSRRQWQKVKDSSVLHEGTFKGYATVYIVDFDENSYYRAPDYTEDLAGYPVYRRSNGSYYIRYNDTKYTLTELEDPIPLTESGSYALRWKFRSNYFIEEIPSSW